MKWYDLWAIYFYKIDNPALWQDELARTVSPSPKDGEIEGAVRVLSEDEDRTRNPTLIHLRAQVYRTRRENALANQGASGCGVCYKGWLDTRPDPQDPDYIRAVPCLCATGKRWLEEKYDVTLRAGLRAEAKTRMEEQKKSEN